MCEKANGKNCSPPCVCYGHNDSEELMHVPNSLCSQDSLADHDTIFTQRTVTDYRRGVELNESRAEVAFQRWDALN